MAQQFLSCIQCEISIKEKFCAHLLMRAFSIVVVRRRAVGRSLSAVMSFRRRAVGRALSAIVVCWRDSRQSFVNNCCWEEGQCMVRLYQKLSFQGQCEGGQWRGLCQQLFNEAGWGEGLCQQWLDWEGTVRGTFPCS